MADWQAAYSATYRPLEQNNAADVPLQLDATTAASNGTAPLLLLPHWRPGQWACAAARGG